MPDFINMIESALRPLKNRILMAIARGVIEAAKDDQGVQTLKLSLLADEERDQMERFQEYGFTSVPKEGAECVAVFMNGNRDNGIVIATEDGRYRLKNLENGEVALYTDEGDKIHFQRGGKIVIESSNVEIGSGLVDALVKSTAFISLFNAHTHLVPAGPPIAPSGPPLPLATPAVATTNTKAS